MQQYTNQLIVYWLSTNSYSPHHELTIIAGLSERNNRHTHHDVSKQKHSQASYKPLRSVLYPIGIHNICTLYKLHGNGIKTEHMIMLSSGPLFSPISLRFPNQTRRVQKAKNKKTRFTYNSYIQFNRVMCYVVNFYLLFILMSLWMAFQNRLNTFGLVVFYTTAYIMFLLFVLFHQLKLC